MAKLSRRQILREAQSLFDQVQSLRKENQSLSQIIFGLAVKLYRLSPDDESFTNGSFQDLFLKRIKKAAEATVTASQPESP